MLPLKHEQDLKKVIISDFCFYHLPEKKILKTPVPTLVGTKNKS